MSDFLDVTACTTSVLPYATDLLLRVALLPGSPLVDMNPLVTLAMKSLQKMEEDVEVVPVSHFDSERAQYKNGILPPHSARGLFDCDRTDPVREWGECVERLWRACISRDDKCPEWDALTHRLLVWNGIHAGRTVVGEWARKETIRCLGLAHQVL